MLLRWEKAFPHRRCQEFMQHASISSCGDLEVIATCMGGIRTEPDSQQGQSRGKDGGRRHVEISENGIIENGQIRIAITVPLAIGPKALLYRIESVSERRKRPFPRHSLYMHLVTSSARCGSGIASRRSGRRFAGKALRRPHNDA